MIYKIAQYKIRKNKRAAVVRAIREFVHAVRRREPGTRYEAYQLPDGVSFIHFMAFKNPSAEKKHRTVPHTKKFVGILYPNCTREPKFTTLRAVR